MEIIQLPPTLQEIIARVPAWQAAKDIQLERIAGLTNVNYRVTVDGERLPFASCFIFLYTSLIGSD